MAVLALSANGCGRQGTQTSAGIWARAARTESRAATFRPDPQQAALIRMQVQPLYQEAEQACKGKQYAKAAELLHRLSRQHGLNAEEVAFVQQQRVLCLQDAGLPVPVLQRASLSSAVVPHPPALNTTSPADVDCGPRALLLVCKQMGITSSLEALRQAAGTSGAGTSLAGLETAAKAVGLKAEGVQVSRTALPDIDMPAIAYVNGNHFVAVLALQGSGENGTATLHDPNHAREETVSQERLLRLCSGYLLLLHK